MVDGWPALLRHQELRVYARGVAGRHGIMDRRFASAGARRCGEAGSIGWLRFLVIG